MVDLSIAMLNYQRVNQSTKVFLSPPRSLQPPRGARAMHRAALLSARSAGPAWTLRSTPGAARVFGVVSPGAPGVWRKYREWNFTSIITSGWWLTYPSEKYENGAFHR